MKKTTTKEEKEIFIARSILVLWTDAANIVYIVFLLSVIPSLAMPKNIMVTLFFITFLVMVAGIILSSIRELRKIFNFYIIKEVAINFAILIIAVTLSSNIWLLGLGIIGIIRTGIHLNPKLYL